MCWRRDQRAFVAMVFGVAPRFRSDLLPPSPVALDLQPGMSVAFPRRQLPSAVPWPRQDRAAAATGKPIEKKYMFGENSRYFGEHAALSFPSARSKLESDAASDPVDIRTCRSLFVFNFSLTDF